LHFNSSNLITVAFACTGDNNTSKKSKFNVKKNVVFRRNW